MSIVDLLGLGKQNLTARQKENLARYVGHEFPEWGQEGVYMSDPFRKAQIEAAQLRQNQLREIQLSQELRDMDEVLRKNQEIRNWLDDRDQQIHNYRLIVLRELERIRNTGGSSRSSSRSSSKSSSRSSSKSSSRGKSPKRRSRSKSRGKSPKRRSRSRSR